MTCQTVVVAVDGSEGSMLGFYHALKTSTKDDHIKIFHGQHSDVTLDGDGMYRTAAISPERKRIQDTLVSLLQSECRDQDV